MIGIDITRISRFEKMTGLARFLDKFHVDGDTALEAAKTWACLEAVYKAEAGGYTFTDIKILFPKNQPPKIIELRPVLKYDYTLSLSHDHDLVVAVALARLR